MGYRLLVIETILLLSTFFVFGQSSYIVVNEPDSELLRDAKIIGRKNQTMTLDNYPQMAEKIVQYLENHGYPFAAVNLTTEWENDSTPQYVMHIDRGRFTKIDSIVLKGNLKLNKNFLWPYLGLRRKAPYSEETLRAVADKLTALPFATVVQVPGVAFGEEKTVLYVYLDKRQVNRFDGYIGFQPVSELTGKLAINGELSLSLQNIFHLGESLALDWRSSERYSQYLNIDAQFPYLFRTRFGLDGHFRLDKQDTTYLTLDYHLGIPYHFRPDSYIRPYINIKQSQLLNKNSGTTVLDTAYMDYRNILYGLSFQLSHLTINPDTKFGYFLAADAAAGRRTLLPGSTEAIPSTDLVKTSYRITGEATGLIPLFKHRVYLILTTKFGSLLRGPHYLNEMFKIGGIGQIRGFRENELLASTYLLYSAELRYLFGHNNYDVHIFFDGGTYEQQGYNSYLFDNPFGFGVGVNIGVRSGTFYFDYALPRQMGNKISFKTGKIHFGVKVKF